LDDGRRNQKGVKATRPRAREEWRNAVERWHRMGDWDTHGMRKEESRKTGS